MRAAVLDAYGPPSNLVVREVPAPALERPSDVRVQVHAAAINPIDWKIRGGCQRGAIRYRLPWVLGLDLSGVVTEVGSAVSRLQVGDEVFGSPDWRRWGSYAQQCILPEANLVPKPPRLSHVEAASLPLVAQTVHQCLLPRLAARPGQRVLIQAGSGGVGTIAIQVAKAHGAWVATTCSERNRELVIGLGADVVVDYRTQRWWEVVSELDVVLDALGGEERERALHSVPRGGRVASIVSGLPANTDRWGPTLGTLATGIGIAGFRLRGLLRGVDARTVVRRVVTAQLEDVAGWVERGVLRPVIDRTLPLEEVAEAHAYGESGRIRGKVVLVIEPPVA